MLTILYLGGWVLLWIASAVVVYGLSFAYWSDSPPHVMSPAWNRETARGMMYWSLLLGPIMLLMTFYLSERAKYGCRWR